MPNPGEAFTKPELTGERAFLGTFSLDPATLRLKSQRLPNPTCLPFREGKGQCGCQDRPAYTK
jgi:hypothetical protein